MYQQELTTPEFLRVTYRLMLKKVLKIREINSKQKRGKIPLPELKKKLEMTSEILEALRVLISTIDFEADSAEELCWILNTIGQRLSLANIDLDDDMYQNIIDILDGFLEQPDL